MAEVFTHRPIPLPSSLASTGRTRFVGRADALAQLGAAFTSALKPGPRRITLVAGEPGIGKTRLAAEFCTAAGAEGALVLLGRCAEEALVPYQPFVELLRYYIAHTDDASLRSQLGYGAADVARILPELAGRLGLVVPASTDRDRERYLLFEGVRAFLDALAAERPLIVVLDDLHWADAPTLMLLKHIVRSDEAARILVIGAYRETDLDRQHPLTEVLADLRREAGHERLHLRGLDVQETEELLQAVARHEVTPGTRAFAEAVQRETEGNPFFLHEVVRHFKETGKVYERDGFWRSDVASIADLGIPEGVKEVVGRRLSRLSTDCQAALGRASVQGRDFELAVLERVSDLPLDRLLDGLDEAVAAGLAEEADGADGRYRFSHALVRQTLYSELNTTRRVRLHRQVGEALEALGAGEKPERHGELAYHFCEAATSGVGEQAVRYSLKAADRAFAAAAYEDVVAWAERGLDLAVADPSISPLERAALLIRLGEGLGWLGRMAEAVPVLDRALRELPDDAPGELFARAAIERQANARVPFAQPNDENIGILLEAGRRLGPGHARLPELLWFLHKLLLDVDGPKAMHFRDLVASSSPTDPPARVIVSIAAAGQLYSARRYAEAAAALREAANNALAAGLRRQYVEAGAFELQCLFRVGDMNAYEYRLSAHAFKARQLRDTENSLVLEVMWPAQLAWFRGDEAEFERLALQADAETALGKNWYAVIVQPFARGNQRMDQGRLAEVWDGLAPLVDTLGDTLLMRVNWARLRIGLGDSTLAHQLLADQGALGFPDEAAGFGEPIRAGMAELCALLGETRYGEALYQCLLPDGPFLWDTGNPHGAWGSTWRPLGMLAALMGRYDDAARHFEDAIAFETAMPHRPALAKSTAEYAVLLLKRNRAGDREQARALATAAVSQAEPLGMRPTVERAQAVLDALGSPKRPAYPAGLSEREVEVLRLVAHGLTNAQVAEALVVSPPTVASHVQSIFNKTGSPNRAAATRWFGQSGLDTST